MASPAASKDLIMSMSALPVLRSSSDAFIASIMAIKETATLEKLKEHKLEDYRKAEQKDEEQRIEEFVSTTRAMAAMGI